MSNKAVFLDRDNTLIEDPGYINNPEQVKLLDGATEAIIELKDLGYKLIVATNQSAVARGIIPEKVLAEIHGRLKQLLAEKGAYLDQIYYCPYHPEGVIPKYRKESDMRKPNPGMLLTAAQEMDIDLNQSWLIGDSGRDIEAGLRAGCKTILINRSSYYKQAKPDDPKPHYSAVNLKEATNIIKKYLRSDSTSGLVTSSPQAPGDIEPQIQPASHGEVETNSQHEEKTLPTEHQEEAQSRLEGVAEDLSSECAADSAGDVTAALPQQANSTEQQVVSDRTEQLLNSILEQLKNMQRDEMFNEFSVMRLLAGIVQIVVLFCLLLAIWFLMSPTGQDTAVLTSLGFAVVLQIMTLTFYQMTSRK